MNPCPATWWRMSMLLRCKRISMGSWLALVLVALTAPFAFAAQQAVNVTIDGNPADLRAAVLARSGSGLAFDLDSTNQGTELCNAVLRVKSNWTAGCSYTNAYDL